MRYLCGERRITGTTVDSYGGCLDITMLKGVVLVDLRPANFTRKSVVGHSRTGPFNGLIYDDTIVQREFCHSARLGYLSADDTQFRFRF